MNNVQRTSPNSASRLIAIQKDSKILEQNEELRSCLLDFVADFAAWDNSTDKSYLKTCRELTQCAHESLGGVADTRPLIADPFGGGGAIPLEGLRVGADVFSSDLNPVAVAIQKVVLQYIPRYGERLGHELSSWLDWAKREAVTRLGEVYPKDNNGAEPVAYLWARTVLSEAPGEPGEAPVEVPMLTTMWLARQKNRKRAVRWVRDRAGKVKTEEVLVKYADGNARKVRRPLLQIFEPKSSNDVERGTAARNSATCPVTNFTTHAKRVEAQLKARNGGAKDARLYCVVIDSDGASRDFRLPTEADVLAAERAEKLLTELEKKWKSPVSLRPTEVVPLMSGVFNAPIYGHGTWESLFTTRQLLAIATYASLVHEYTEKLSDKEPDYRQAVAMVLGMVIDRLADLNAALCGWQLNTPNSAHVFTRWALPMIMDFAEINPLAGAGGSPESAIRRASAYIKDVGVQFPGTAEVQLSSAAALPLPDDSVSLIATDPPYYNAIPYADLMDFFYVWLRRSIGDFFPALFSAEATPKTEELCEMSGWDPVRYANKDKSFFEREMTIALRRAREVVRPDGLGIVVFAHKTTSGWEAMLQALVDAGWIITASWPIDTEMESRSRARNSATLGSSVHLVCRPRPELSNRERTHEVGDWRDVLAELPRRIHQWLPRLADEGIVGADAIFACLGPALEIFSNFTRVEKASGEVVSLKDYLEQVWAAVAKEALTMIFKDADTAGFEEDARLTAMWLWTLNSAQPANGKDSADEDATPDSDEGGKKQKVTGFILEYDAARKIAQGLGAHIEDMRTLVEVSGESARLLPVDERTRYLFTNADHKPTSATKKKRPQRDLFAEEENAEALEAALSADLPYDQPGKTILDRIHQAMILFGAGRGEALKRFIIDEGVGRDAKFWSLAQALSAIYPTHTTEKRWVDGVLARKKSFGF